MIVDNLDAMIKDAMKAKESKKLSALRMLKTKLITEKSSGKDYTNDSELKVLNQYIKQIGQSYDAYKEAGNIDDANDCQYELTVIRSFLPTMLSEEGVREFIKSEYGDNDVNYIKRNVFKDLKGKAESVTINKILKELAQ